MEGSTAPKQPPVWVRIPPSLIKHAPVVKLVNTEGLNPFALRGSQVQVLPGVLNKKLGVTDNAIRKRIKNHCPSGETDIICGYEP